MTTELEQEIRRTFDRRVAGLSVPSARSSSAARVRKLARHMIVVRFSLVVLLLGLSVAAGTSVARLMNDSPTNQEFAIPPRNNATDRSSPDALTSEQVLASGSWNGDTWALKGYLAANTSDDEMLCLVWEAPDAQGMDVCIVDLTEGLDPGQYVVSQTVDNPLYGEVSKEVDRVEIIDQEGTSVPGSIFETPKGWGLPFNMFVGFATNDGGDITVVARDTQGNVLERETHEALPVLTVMRSGAGQGHVTGFSTEEALCKVDCEAPRTWIDCGQRCEAELDGARITLVAASSDNDVFVGWKGGCSGTAECELVVDRDLQVEAVFENK